MGVDGDSFSKNENITSVRIRTEHPFFIGDKAFSKCSNMKALIIDAWDMIKIGKNVVDEGTVTLYVQDFWWRIISRMKIAKYLPQSNLYGNIIPV